MQQKINNYCCELLLAFHCFDRFRKSKNQITFVAEKKARQQQSRLPPYCLVPEPGNTRQERRQRVNKKFMLPFLYHFVFKNKVSNLPYLKGVRTRYINILKKETHCGLEILASDIKSFDETELTLKINTPQPLYNTIVGVQANFRVSYPIRVISRV